MVIIPGDCRGVVRSHKLPHSHDLENDMISTAQSDYVRGKTLRLSWVDGPTKGTTQEHVFHVNGTVQWHSVPDDSARVSAKDKPPLDRPKYADERVADGIRLVSYLSRSGYTLTLVLNFASGTTVGIASNENTWLPVHGTFEVVV
jgi:hypothetical protein